MAKEPNPQDTPAPTPTADRYQDAELWQMLAVTADTDRGQSPFGWSALPSPDTGGIHA
ncbi:hypothetical protein [Streptomyces cadmiisoli]|uniref:hypothetical protein n=1 Tax=Streptomyces cadmiisoli TaxID=2184053 RepID=UPI0036625B1C